MCDAPAMVTYRPATPDDAAAITRLVMAGIRAYGWLAPPGWEPPGEDVDREAEQDLARRLVDIAWGFVAEDPDGLAGVATMLPASTHRRPDPDPALVHLWHLFVAEPHWGTRVARRLHADALGAAAARGFTAARLYTPAGQVRARRFYEREGWAAAGDPFFDDAIGFEVVEYRRVVG